MAGRTDHHPSERAIMFAGIRTGRGAVGRISCSRSPEYAQELAWGCRRCH
jgi:hypothetical protein